MRYAALTRILPVFAALGPWGAGCSRTMESVANTPPAADLSNLPGKPDWNALPSPSVMLTNNEYQPPTLFPCQNCHATKPPDPTPRAFAGMHSDVVFNHDDEHRWCFGCHNPEDRDYLRLADGKLIDFRDHFELCGQCHGTEYRDWRAGIHGKRTGEWNGTRRWWTCVECHNPHSPKFGQLAPEPPPDRPMAQAAMHPVSPEAGTVEAVRKKSAPPAAEPAPASGH